MDSIEVLRDATDRPGQALAMFVDRLDPVLLNAHRGEHPNSIAWLLWHAARQMDVQLAHLAATDQVWAEQGFRERFALPKVGDTIGYGHSPEQARQIRVDDAGLLVDYLRATSSAMQDYLGTLGTGDLDTVVDDSYDPPVTIGVRLISIIDDAVAHVAQAAYVTGMD